MKRLLVTISLTFFISIIIKAQSNEIVLQPGAEGKDAILSGNSPDANNGNHINNYAIAWTYSGTPMYLRAIFEFDLSSIPTNAYITEVKLSLFYVPTSYGAGEHCSEDGPNECFISRVIEPWDESTVTWNNQPSVSDENQVLLPASTHVEQDYKNIDVTGLVQDMFDNGNNGFLLKLKNESHYRRLTFGSSDCEDETKRPKLVIKYTMNDGTNPEKANGLTANESSPLNIELNWHDNASNESNYIIEQSEGTSTNYEPVDTLAANATSTTITENISNKTKYYFRVKAVDANGYYSYSDEVSIITGSISVSDGDTTICNKYYFDSGVTFPYNSHENLVQTITPEIPGKILKIRFNTFSLSSGDKLTVYDGSSVTSPILEELTGTSLPDSIIATNSEGKLTFKFTSGGDILKNQGWEAYISCIDPVFAPHNLTITLNSSDTIKFSWSDTISIETGFEVQRSINGTDFSTIHTTGENIIEYEDVNGIYTGSEYYYRLRTITTESYSPWSDTLYVLTPGPEAPSDLIAESTNDTTLVLTWTDNSDNETGFVVERSLNSESGFSQITEVSSNTITYSDKELTFNTEYYYRIRAVLGNDSSNYTSTVHVLAGGAIMDDMDITRCNYYLLDPGGLENYPSSLNKTITLNPVEAGKYIKLDFELFNLESNCDKLYIYDGSTVSDPLINVYTGSSIPDSINATNTSGSLTLKMTSDGTVTKSGFKIHVTCIDIPNIPTDLNLIDAGTNEITFGWTDNSTDETGFIIYRSDELEGTYAIVGNVEENTDQYTDINLNSGKTYYYKLQVSGIEGYSEFSDTLQIETTGPLAPSVLSARSTDDTSVNLVWTDNSDNEDIFIIERSLEATTGFEIIDSVGVDTTTYVDSALVFNTVYYYRVLAITGQDSSEYTNTASVLTGSVVMDDTTISRCNYYLLDPGGLDNYSNNENKTIVLQPSVVGAKVRLDFESFTLHNNYDFLYVYDGSTVSDPLIATLTGSTLPDSIIASNDDGVLTLKFTSNSYTTYSGFKIQVRCFLVPLKPSELTLTTSETTSLSFAWKDNSDNEEEFFIYRSLLENGSFNIIDTTLENNNEYTDNELVSGTTYYYSVRASGEDGISNFSDTLTAVTAGPKAPSDLIAKATGNSSIELTWTDNSNNEEGFIIERSLNESSDFEQIAIVNTNIDWYDDEGLTFNIEYFYRIRAYVADDSSEYTTTVSAKAGNVVFDDGYISSCNYYLLDPGGEDNYESSLDKTLKLFPLVAGEKVKLSFDVFDLENSFDKLYIHDGSLISDPLIATLTGNTLPDSIWATNSEGALTLRFVSDDSNTRTGFIANVNCIYVPINPSDLSLTDATKNSLNISWTDNSDNETGFIIYRSLSETGNFEAYDTVAENIATYIDDNLSSGFYYYYKVKAISSEAYSGYSNLLTAKTLGLKTPSDLNAVSNNSSSATLSWIDNSSDETGFSIERSLAANVEFDIITTVDANITEYTDNTVEIDKTYKYRIKAFHTTDTSDYSNLAIVSVGSYVINNENISRCDFYLLDPGGSDNYPNSSDKWVNITPTETGKVIKLNFIEFDLGDDNDSLIVLNGNISSELLSAYTESSITDSLWARNTEGQLHIRFTSDESLNASGFKIYVGCVDALNAPTNLTGIGTYSDSLKIEWSDNSNNETSFELYRSLTIDGNYDLIKQTESNATSYLDTNLSSNTTYYYKARAINSEIYSDFTEILTISTITSNIGDQINDLIYNIYPNPTNDNINIQISNKYNGKVYIEIYSISGSLLEKIVYEKTDNELFKTINIGDFSNGVYMLNIRFNDKKIVNQIIKE